MASEHAGNAELARLARLIEQQKLEIARLRKKLETETAMCMFYADNSEAWVRWSEQIEPLQRRYLIRARAYIREGE